MCAHKCGSRDSWRGVQGSLPLRKMGPIGTSLWTLEAETPVLEAWSRAQGKAE